MRKPEASKPIDATVQTRLNSLERLIDHEYGGSSKTFEVKTGIRMAQINQWFSGYRALRDKALKRLEEKTCKPAGWFDSTEALITERVSATTTQDATITRGSQANTPTTLHQTLADLSAYLERLDADDRAEAMKMIAVLADKPERHSKVAASIEGMVTAAFAHSRRKAA